MDFAVAELPGAELHRALAVERTRAAIAQVNFGGKPTWLISGYETLQAAFKVDRNFKLRFCKVLS